ncbi:MAG: hypothetical protein P8181_09310, partial [bacterium]
MRSPVVAAGILLMLGVSRAAGGPAPETDGRLALEIVMLDGDLRVGEHLDFEIRFENVSGDSLRIY